MSIQQIRSILTKKNLNRSISAVVDYLETLGVGGGSSGTGSVDAVETISIPVNFSDLIPSFDTTTAELFEISVTTDGETTSGVAELGLPRGRNAYDRIILNNVANESSNRIKLIITSSLGFSIFDPSNVYLIPTFEILEDGSANLVWDDNFEIWIVDREENTTLPEFVVGKTVYEVTYDDTNTSVEIYTGYSDIVTRLYSNAVNAPQLDAVIYNGNIGGQRMGLSIDVSGLTLTSIPNNFLLPDNTIVQSITCNNVSASILLEWKASSQNWVILDYTTGIVVLNTD